MRRFFVVDRARGKVIDPVTGEGGSKRQAEQDAATRLLAHCHCLFTGTTP